MTFIIPAVIPVRKTMDITEKKTLFPKRNGEIKEKDGILRSSKRKGNGIGIQSVRRIAEKNSGDAVFTYDDGLFTARVMLRG